MKLIIIVTIPIDDLWKEAERGWQRADVLKETEVRVRSVGADEVAVFCQAGTSRSSVEQEREAADRLTTTGWVVQVAQAPRYAAATVYVAAHQGYVAFDKVRAGVAAERFGAGTNFNHEPGRPPARKVYDDLLELVSDPGPDTFGAALRAVKKNA
jgi:hypothetical protein